MQTHTHTPPQIVSVQLPLRRLQHACVFVCVRTYVREQSIRTYAHNVYMRVCVCIRVCARIRIRNAYVCAAVCVRGYAYSCVFVYAYVAVNSYALLWGG